MLGRTEGTYRTGSMTSAKHEQSPCHDEDKVFDSKPLSLS